MNTMDTTQMNDATASKTLMQPGALLTAKDFTESHYQLEADVVVIGSGAGGAVAAYELARRGKRVIMLEAGRYLPSSRFTEQFPDMMAKLYADGGNQASRQGDLLILQGQCVGGSTVVNGCVAFRIPDYILDKWQHQHGLSNLTEATLAPYYARAEQHLSVHINEEYEINANSRQLRAGAQKLGWSVKPLARNTKTCALTGHCLSGCKTDRKQSMLVTYVPWALQKGAQLYSNTRAERIMTDGGRATGVLASVYDPQTGKPVSELTITAPQVFCAAGAIQTPLLFQRSELLTSHAAVGRNLACHPSTMVVAEFDEDIYTWRGAMLGVYVDEFKHPDRGGFVLEGGGAGPVELGMSSEPGTGQPYIDFMLNARRYASCVTLIHDQNVGSVGWEDGRKVIDYELADADFEAIKQAVRAAAEAYFAAGASKVFLPTVASRVATTLAEVDSHLKGLRNQPFTWRMVSYHPQGTMRMGADSANSVVNPRGECHDIKGLYVTDASLFPTSIVVNPQMTVYALAAYIAEQSLKGAT